MAEGDVVVNCENKDAVDTPTLLASCIGVDADGNRYIRRVDYAQQAGEGDAIACNNRNATGEELLMNELRKCVVKNSENKNALRFGTI